MPFRKSLVHTPSLSAIHRGRWLCPVPLSYQFIDDHRHGPAGPVISWPAMLKSTIGRLARGHREQQAGTSLSRHFGLFVQLARFDNVLALHTSGRPKSVNSHKPRTFRGRSRAIYQHQQFSGCELLASAGCHKFCLERLRHSAFCIHRYTPRIPN
jgi:hypothetical protein